MKQLTLKMSYTTPPRLGLWNNGPSSSIQVVASQNLPLNEQQYQQSLLKEQPRKRSPPLRNMKTCFLRKLPPNYHPPDHMTTPSNSRTCSYPNGPRPTCSIPSNIKPARRLSKNISRQEKFLLQNPPKLHHSYSSKRKKLGNYDPAKTTSFSIVIPSRMPIPSLLSLTSLTNYENH